MNWWKWLGFAALLMASAILGGWLDRQPWSPGLPKVDWATLGIIGALTFGGLAAIQARRERSASLRNEHFKRRLDACEHYLEASQDLFAYYRTLTHRPPAAKATELAEHLREACEPELRSERWWQEFKETERVLYGLHKALHLADLHLPNDQLSMAGKVCTAAAYWRDTILATDGPDCLEHRIPTVSGQHQFGNAYFDLINSLRAFNGMDKMVKEVGELVRATESTVPPMYRDPFERGIHAEEPGQDTKAPREAWSRFSALWRK
ncbi:MAG: hypothetical protein ACHQ50_10855 [Fimbriimonadales bacterium]